VSGKPINSEQVKIYMEARANSTTQKKASVQSGISERSGRRIEKGELQPTGRKKRNWRTRKDPFSNVWDSEIVPLLKNNLTSLLLLSLNASKRIIPVNTLIVNFERFNVKFVSGKHYTAQTRK